MLASAFAAKDEDEVLGNPFDRPPVLLPFLRGVVVESSGCEAVADDDEVVGPGGPLAGPGMTGERGRRRALI